MVERLGLSGGEVAQVWACGLVFVWGVIDKRLGMGGSEDVQGCACGVISVGVH